MWHSPGSHGATRRSGAAASAASAAQLSESGAVHVHTSRQFRRAAFNALPGQAARALRSAQRGLQQLHHATLEGRPARRESWLQPNRRPANLASEDWRQAPLRAGRQSAAARAAGTPCTMRQGAVRAAVARDRRPAASLPRRRGRPSYSTRAATAPSVGADERWPPPPPQAQWRGGGAAARRRQLARAPTRRSAASATRWRGASCRCASASSPEDARSG